MGKTPLVSILMTAYNRENFIAEAIESVLASHYSCFELIIVDDCSTDATVDVITPYAEKDTKVRFFKNEKNLGQFHNRNKAASLAEGKYLKFVDSDDIIYPYALDIMVDAMERFPNAGLGVFSNLQQDTKPYPFLLTSKEAFEQYYFQKSDVLGIGPTGVIFRTDAFKKVKGFANFSVAGDTELMLRLTLHYPVVKIGTSQFWWRRHEGQAFSVNGARKEYTIQQYLVNRSLFDNPLFPLPTHTVERLHKAYTRLLIRSVVKNFLFKRDVASAKEILVRTKFRFPELVKSILPTKPKKA